MKTKISSKATAYYKIFLPYILLSIFSAIFVMLSVAALQGRDTGAGQYIMVLVAILIVGSLYWWNRKLADEVWIDGDQIVVGRNGQFEVFRFSEIVEIVPSVFARPVRIRIAVVRKLDQVRTAIDFIPAGGTSGASGSAFASYLISEWKKRLRESGQQRI